jgi:hypothetical protein
LLGFVLDVHVMLRERHDQILGESRFVGIRNPLSVGSVLS